MKQVGDYYGQVDGLDNKSGLGRCVINSYPEFLGEIHEGEWENGKLNGYGRIIFSNGDIYEGQFKDHKFHGYGVHIKNVGIVLRGKFENNKFITF